MHMNAINSNLNGLNNTWASSLPFWIIFASLILLNAWAVNSVSIKPFPDTANHLAAASIISQYTEAGTPYQELFDLDVGIQPNTLHLHIVSSGFLGHPMTASHIIFTLFVIVTPLLIWSIIRVTGGNQWAVLLSFPFLYSFTVTYGFTEFMMSIPFLLATILALFIWIQRPSWLSWIALALLFFLASWAHVFVFVFSLMMIVLTILIRYRKQPTLCFLGFASIIPGTIMIAIWYTSRESSPTTLISLLSYYKRIYWSTLGTRFSDWLFLDNRVLINPSIGPYIGLFFKVVVLSVAAWRMIVWLRARTKDAGDHWLKRLAQAPALVPVCVTATACFVVCFGPFNLPPSAMWVYQRFPFMVFIGLVLILAIGPWSRRDQRILIFIGCFVAYVYTGLWIEHFAGFQGEQEDFLAVLPEDHNNQIVGFYIEDTTYRGDPEALIHFGNYLTTLHQGISVNAMYDYPLWPIQRTDQSDVLPIFYEINELDAYLAYPHIKQIIHRGKSQPSIQFLSQYELARQHGQWELYQAIQNNTPETTHP